MKRIGIGLIALAALSGCNVERVDDVAAVAVADRFYNALKASDVPAAVSLLSRIDGRDTTWPRLFSGLQERNGPVSATQMDAQQLVSDGEVPCYWLRYSVKRSELASREELLVCRNQDGAAWTIAGLRLTRLDTGQAISGGKMPSGISAGTP